MAAVEDVVAAVAESSENPPHLIGNGRDISVFKYFVLVEIHRKLIESKAVTILSKSRLMLQP